MTDRIATALKATKKSSPQMFSIGTHFSQDLNEGVVFVNLQNIHAHTYAVWFVGSEGNRFAGGYYEDYAEAVADFNGRLIKIVDRELALAEGK